MNDLKIEQTRTERMKHFFVRPFVPIFERMEEKYIFSKKFGESGRLEILPRYEKGNMDWMFSVTPTSIPKKVWPVTRVKRKRSGQLELIKV